MPTIRDPRTDPQTGDLIVKSTGTGRKVSRYVVKRAGNDITYRDHRGKERLCWITTWETWAREAEVEGRLD